MRLQPFFGLVCVLSITNIASSQTKPPAAPPGTVQQVQSGQTAANFYPTHLYRMSDVSKTMNLTQDQIGNLNKLTEQTQGQYRDNYSKLNTLNNADQLSRLQEINRQYSGDWNKGARSIFNDDQWSRYQQLNHQYGGFNTLYDPDVQKQLNLSPDQIKNLDENRTWSNKQLHDIYGVGYTDPTKGTQLYRDYWKQHQERLNRFLTTEQQKAWLQMTGEPYTFQPDFTSPR